MPEVSVIIPTYQRRDLVVRAVRSALGQTVRDLEVLVIDDGSDDGTREALAGLDPRVRYQWQPNRGVAAARNAGVRAARAPVLAFLDSDDHWRPSHLEVAVGALTRHPSAVLVSTCPGKVIGGRERPEDAALVDLLGELLLGASTGYLSAIAVRRAALLDAGGFDEELPVGEDTDLWRRLAVLGPFSLVRRRTLVHRPTAGGLRETGRRTGAYLGAAERSLGRLVGEIERRRGPDGRHLADRGRAYLCVLDALRAVDAGEEAAARARLAEACRLAPELSDAPYLLVSRIRSSAYGPGALLHRQEWVAALWPDPASDTPRFLRACAALHALRLGQPARARRLLAGRPSLAHPGFLVRAVPLAARLARVYLQERASSV
jgi:hypothetical protein